MLSSSDLIPQEQVTAWKKLRLVMKAEVKSGSLVMWRLKPETMQMRPGRHGVLGRSQADRCPPSGLLASPAS